MTNVFPIFPSIITLFLVVSATAYAIHFRREWSRGEGFGNMFLLVESALVGAVLVCICLLVWGWHFLLT